MKFVINTCYGGFGLSYFGIHEYLKRKGLIPYFYKQSKYKHLHGIDEFVKCQHYWNIIVTKDYGDTTNNFLKGDLFYDKEIPRNDQDLVYIVETYKELTFGSCSKLEVVDIAIEYDIENHDGKECISIYGIKE